MNGRIVYVIYLILISGVAVRANFRELIEEQDDAEIVTTRPPVTTRPLYNIGHMANDIAQADQFLADGANALESDLRFEPNGRPSKFYHGAPCDCFRNCFRQEELRTFLEHARERSTPGAPSYTDRLALLILDLKLLDVDDHRAPLYSAGDAVANALVDHVFQNGTSNTTLRLLLGIPTPRQSAAVRGIRESFERRGLGRLLDRIGYQVTDEENMDEVQQTFRGIGVTGHIWQGDGITNCVAGRGDGRLRRAIGLRDAPTGPWVRVDKVYRWTIDTKTAMRHTLRLGVDAIMTNDPDDVVKVLKEPEFNWRFRLATNEDDPFEKIEGPGPLRFGCSRNYCWRDCTFSGRWCWTASSGCGGNRTMCHHDLPCSGECGK